MQLASAQPGHTNQANHQIASMCVENPLLLEQISEGLLHPKVGFQADCAEVMTLVAEKNPSFVVPYMANLLPLAQSRNTRARWEAMHALALCTGEAPAFILAALPRLSRIAVDDSSVIVRDYATEAIARLASCGQQEAKEAFGALLAVLERWNDRHGRQLIPGFVQVARACPELREEAIGLLVPLASSERKSVAKEAAKALKGLSTNRK